MGEEQFDFYRELRIAGNRMLKVAEYTPEGRRHRNELYDMVVYLVDMMHEELVGMGNKKAQAGRGEHGEG